MRFLYSLLIILSTPLVLIYLALRGLRDPAYLGRWNERFGFISPTGMSGGILLHAASVGEFNAASPLIRELLKAYPDLPLTVTTLTPTGSERVRRELGDKVYHAYVPLDLPGAVSRFFTRLQPRLLIVMETEIWPNLYLAAHDRNIPVVMANARLSGSSVRRYQRFSGLIRQVLKPVSWIGAQSIEDTHRLLACGARSQDTQITGNLKFDLRVPTGLHEEGLALRSSWGSSRPVLVAGSTHEADEKVIIPGFVALLQDIPDAILILVPRHPERFKRAAQAARSAGLEVKLLSEGGPYTQQTQCLVIDTMGKLMNCYASADAVFVGGSMGEQGGHNALEPAALGKAIMVGPNMANAREIVAELIDGGAVIRVCDQAMFRESAKKLLSDNQLREQMGQAGLALVDKNKGALDMTLAAISRLMKLPVK